MAFKKISPQELNENFFTAIGKDWMLITAQTGDKANPMTASWGGLGVLWRRDVVFVFVRHSRYTFNVMETAENFSLTFFPPKLKKILSYCGTTSGRKENKISKSDLTLLYHDGTPYFAEARLAIFCRKLYAQDITPTCFADSGLIGDFYGDGDFHRMYVGEILTILTQ